MEGEGLVGVHGDPSKNLIKTKCKENSPPYLVVAAALSVRKMRRGVVVSELDFMCGMTPGEVGVSGGPVAAAPDGSPPVLLRDLNTRGCVFWCFSSNIRSGSAPWYHCTENVLVWFWGSHTSRQSSRNHLVKLKWAEATSTHGHSSVLQVPTHYRHRSLTATVCLNVTCIAFLLFF